MPRFAIAVIHEREASQRWDRSIAQGDPWKKVSIHCAQGLRPIYLLARRAFDETPC